MIWISRRRHTGDRRLLTPEILDLSPSLSRVKLVAGDVYKLNVNDAGDPDIIITNGLSASTLAEKFQNASVIIDCENDLVGLGRLGFEFRQLKFRLLTRIGGPTEVLARRQVDDIKAISSPLKVRKPTAFLIVSFALR